MIKNNNSANSNNHFKIINSKNNVNKSKLDQSIPTNTTNILRKDNKQQFNQYLQQQQSARNRTQSTQKKESLSKDKIDIKKQQPTKKLNVTTIHNSSTERQPIKQRTLSSTSRISTVSPQSRTKPTNLKSSQIQQQNINSNQQPTPKATTKKNLFVSSNQKTMKNNESFINKMKPNYDKGKLLPFKKESPPIKLQRQDTNTISTQSIQSRGSKQSLSVHKSITQNKMEAIQRSKTPENKLQNNALSCLVRPIFNGSKYYQTSLVHFYYDQVKSQVSPYKLYFELEYSTIQLKEYFKEIFQTHFQQTFNCLQYCKRFTQNMKQNYKIQNLPQQTQQKKVLVFDLDETLIHCNDNNDDPTDHTIMVTLPNEGPVETRINIRPYCQQMLKLLSNYFELMLFTASFQYYADEVLKLIDPDRKLFQYRFYRDSCIEVEDNLFVKDLRVIGNRRLEDILLIDNASYSYCYQIDHGVPIIPFYDNKYDKELIFLTEYLLNLKKYPQWTYSNKVHFRTYLYQQSSTIDECLREMFKTHEIKDY